MPPVILNFTGPSTVPAGGTSTAFTLTPAVGAITTNVSLSDGGAGGSFTPSSLSWVADSTAKTFVYNAPNVAGTVTITPTNNGPGVGIINPASLNITVVGPAPTARLYQFPRNYGPPPFPTIYHFDNLPAVAATLNLFLIGVGPGVVKLGWSSTTPLYTLRRSPNSNMIPPQVADSGLHFTSYLDLVPLPGSVWYYQVEDGNGQFSNILQVNVPGGPGTAANNPNVEAGFGSVIGLIVGQDWTLWGGHVLIDRMPFGMRMDVNGNGAFDLSYQTSGDNGVTWSPTKQVSATAVNADGSGAGLNFSAKLNLSPSHRFRFTIYNTGSSPLNAVYSWRLYDRSPLR